MMMKRDMGYVRVSTQKESQADSPDNQKSFILASAERDGTQIHGFYEDRDTATSIVTRDDVQRMIAEAKRGEIRSIWFASLSRFSRDALDAISLKRILVNGLKIRVVSIEDGYDSARQDDELLFGVRAVVNQNSSKDNSKSTRRGLRESALDKGNFIGSIAPYGYRKAKDGKRKTLEIVAEQAQIVQMIFDLYVSGSGEKAIVNYLNGTNPQHIRYPSPKGGLWQLSSVQRILQNENYTGFNVFGRHTVEVAYDDLSDLMQRRKKLVQKPKEEWEKSKAPTHPAIISVEKFNLAQELRLVRGGGVRGGRRAFVNVFAKMIFCAECGSSIVCMRSKVIKNEGSKTYMYMMCSKRRRTGEIGCSNGRWLVYYDVRDELIQGIVERLSKRLKALTSGIGDLKIIEMANNFEKEKRKLEKRIEDNRRLLMGIRRQHLLEEIDNVQYEFEKEQYEKEIIESEGRLEAIKKDERKSLNVQSLIKDAKKGLNALMQLGAYDDVEKTRMILLQVVKRISVYADGEIQVETYI